MTEPTPEHDQDAGTEAAGTEGASDPDLALDFTGEFYVPELHGNIELEHVHRYLQACEISEGKVVLDIACGEGYGSYMLASNAARVIGVDISELTIQHARARYDKDNLTYLTGDCSDIPVADDSVDLVVSFETIEHHAQHEEMLREIKRVLRPDGVLLISTPDRTRYSIEPGYNNPYHVKELYGDEFKALISSHFRTATFFGQRIVYGSTLFSEVTVLPTRWYSTESGTSGFTSSPDNRPLYWVALASDATLPPVAAGVFEQPIDEADTVVAYRTAVADRDAQVAHVTAVYESELANSSAAQEAHRREVARISADLSDSEDEVSALLEAAAHRDRRIAELEHSLTTARERTNASERATKDQQQEIAGLTVLAEELARIQSSRLLRLRDVVRSEPFGVNKLAHVSRLSLPMVFPRLAQRAAQRRETEVNGNAREPGVPEAEPNVPDFDSAFYLAAYPDVAAAGMDPLEHYLRHGMGEGRLPTRPTPDRVPGFDAGFYLSEYPDVAAAGVDPLEHYVIHGKAEGRLPRRPEPISDRLPEFTLPRNAAKYRPLVSVIVPTYNHGPYLEERLESIYQQTYDADVEVYLLDDASTDESPAILRSFAQRFPTNTTLISNAENSGSAFRQWRRGLALARGDVVWIAESDDLCDLNFLETMVPFMANPGVMVAYSRTVFFRRDVDDIVLTLEDYLSDVGPFRFDVPWIRTGPELVATGFAEKNLIPNVSGAIFRHPRGMPLLESEQWLDMRLAGDWIFYLELIRCGLVAFSPETTNYHRSSEATLTSQINASASILAVEVARAKAVAHRLYGRGTGGMRAGHLAAATRDSARVP
jgi:SAM-dependent methyltransferase